LDQYRRMKTCYCFILLFFTLGAKGQSTDSLFSVLSTKLALSDTAAHTDLFLHFDKNVYTAGENAWFAAYLLHAARVPEHHTLYVTLVNETDHSVANSYQFVMEQGLASASISIPDSLLSGKYCWVAYTNKTVEERKPYIFRQPIEILGLRKDPYDLQFTGTLQNGSILFTGYMAKKDHNSAAKPAKLELTLLANGKPFQKIQPEVNSLGQIQFTVLAAMASKRLEITGTIGLKKEQMAFKHPLTWAAGQNIIAFYAPSGRLVANQSSQISVSLRNSLGKALAKSCILLENGVEVASFVTDRMGNGLFSFTPKPSKQYTVKLKGEQEIPLQSFPTIVMNKWSIRLDDTMISDTLRLHVNSPADAGERWIAIHNNHALLYGAYLKLRKPETLLKIPVADWEPGIVYVGLYTKDGILQEQQLVLIKNANRISAVLQTDAATYRPLSKVTVRLKLINQQGQPVKGLFSFSTALEQAFTSEAKDIEVFNQFGRFLPDGALLPPANILQSEQNVRSMLLSQERLIADSSPVFQPIGRPDAYNGHVLRNGKKPVKPVTLMLFGSQTTLLQTAADGRFTLPYPQLQADAGKKVMLSVTGKNLRDYRIELTPPHAQINVALAGQNLWHDVTLADELTYEQKQLLASSSNTILKEVVVSAKKADPGNYYGKANTGGVCNDYVCQFDVLNCPYHVGVKTPQEGQRYNLETPLGITKVTYHCEYRAKPLYIKEVPPILPYQPYTAFNPTEQNPPGVTNSTTLHWQAFIQTNERGEANFSFYTNARSGRFKASVQGIASNDGVFSSEIYFEVKR